MDLSSKVKFIGATSAAIALACVGTSYVFKRRHKLREASEAFNLTIKTITTEEECNEVVQELRRRCQKHKAVGFDCEWVTDEGKRHPVALVQLATYDGYSCLFRLSHIKHVPESLKAILEDPTIYKVGVDPASDASYLNMDYSVMLKSTLDVRHIALLCGHVPGGLANLTKNVLHVLLDKSWRIRCSDWEAESLTERQTNYAAADAFVAIKIYVDLINKRHSTGFRFFRKADDDDVWSNIGDLYWQYVDVHFKYKSNSNTPGKSREGKERPSRETREAKCSGRAYANMMRSKPLYHNCFLLAPDGDMLCTCDNNKALWYVSKGLADVVREDPLTVQLRFEPAGRSVGDVGRYYQQVKENKCVVCGATESYIRKNVVPREYRKYFPDIMKEHSSHDVLLLCGSCHQRSNVRDQAVRERLAQLCAAPVAAARDNNRYIEDPLRKKIRGAARALLYQTRKHVLPEARRQQLQALLLQHYPDHSEVTDQLLQEAAHSEVFIENTDYEVHGLKVVEYYLKQEGGLLRLEELWRKHFLESMQPKFLPDLWSVKHNEERMRVRLSEGRLKEEDIKLMGLTKWL